MPIVSLNAITNRKKFSSFTALYIHRFERLAEHYILIVLIKSSASSEDRRVAFAVS